MLPKAPQNELRFAELPCDSDNVPFDKIKFKDELVVEARCSESYTSSCSSTRKSPVHSAKMILSRLVSLVLCLFLGTQALAAVMAGKPMSMIRQESDGLQDIVTWDEHSLFVRGERVLFYSGEVHPFRLPSPDLYLDIFQKIKALGYNGVSFYVDWALLEGERGVYRADGVFALEPFFDAASEAGIYLLARPGPYINAEVSGGGFPGWMNRVDGTFRTNATGFLEATNNYAQKVGETIAKAQITNGGPIILFQPENEYTYPENNITFPNKEYFQYVIDQFRNASIIVPFISNDAGPLGIFAPGNTSTEPVHVDIYGHDSYPQGFDCSHPYNWSGNTIPTTWRNLHLSQSPSTPYSIVEFQGGAFDPWGGPGFENCATLTNEQFQRIFYKNNWSFLVTIFNLYMTYGGTNWGNLGHPLGYTSYDYGSPIAEDRSINREKYHEAKLEANFLKVSPSYFTSIPKNVTNSTYTDNTAIAVTPVLGNGSDTNIYVVRQAVFYSTDSTSYKMQVSTTAGNVTIPQLNKFDNHLTINGRDSKIHVTDYDVGGTTLLYSSAEIFTWQKYDSDTVLILYGGANETHEFALPKTSCEVISGDANSVYTEAVGDHTVVQWQVTPQSKVLRCGSLTIHLLWRNDAYNYWVLELPAADPIYNYSSPSKQSVVVKGGYLMRSAQISNGDLHLNGDVNTTTSVEVIGAPSFNKLYFNGDAIQSSSENVKYEAPNLKLADLAGATWKSIDSLPEISPSYSDNMWTIANNTNTTNQFRPTTPTVLYASDYGYHTGPLFYRGHFATNSDDTSGLKLALYTQGGYGYGYSVYLNDTILYQYPGISTAQNHNTSIEMPSLSANTAYTVTLIIDHMGLTENFNPGNDTMKEPRGLLSYNLTSYSQDAVTWKLTGNLHGEQYVDKTRGPLNEAGMYFERQGYHLPGAPTNGNDWTNSSPMDGFKGPGLKFYSTTFDLDLPTPDYDVPLAFVFTNTSSSAGYGKPTAYRSNLYVNGWQFGKYVNHIGPQLSYPVPEGILNYHGENYVGVSLWSLETDSEVEVKLGGLELKTASTPVKSGRNAVGLTYELPKDGWQKRDGAY